MREARLEVVHCDEISIVQEPRSAQKSRPDTANVSVESDSAIDEEDGATMRQYDKMKTGPLFQNGMPLSAGRTGGMGT